MNKSILALTLIAAAMLSCTKSPEYTLDSIRDVDPEMTLFENGLTLPVSTSMNFKLGELLEDGFVAKDEAGNYFIDADVPQITQELSLAPEISIPKLIKEFGCEYGTGNYAGMTIPSDIRFVAARIDEGLEVDFDFQLPEEVVDIESIELDFPFSLDIAASSSLARLGNGFALQFPEGFRIEKQSSSDTWYDIVEEGGICKAVFNTEVSLAGKLSCALNLTGIDIQPGWISDGAVSVSSQVGISGDFILQGPGAVPAVAGLSFDSKQGDIKVRKVRLKVDAEISLPQQTVDLGVPSDIAADGNVFKFVDTGLDVTLINNTPVPLTVSGTIAVLRKDGAVPAPAHFGAISVDALNSRTLHIDETVCPGLLDILNCMPDQIVVRDLVAICGSPDFIDINAEDEYEAGFSGKIHLPLSFAKGSAFRFETVFENELDLESVASFDRLGINIEMKNDLPVDLDASIRIDIDGQLVEIRTEDGAPIKVETGKNTVLKLVAAKPDKTPFASVGNIEIAAGATVSSDKAVFNDRNELAIRVISVSAPGGITLKLK